MEMSRRKFNNSIAYNPISHKTQAIDDKPMNPLNSVHNLLDPSSGVDQWTEIIKFNAQQEALEHEKRRADKLKQQAQFRQEMLQQIQLSRLAKESPNKT